MQIVIEQLPFTVFDNQQRVEVVGDVLPAIYCRKAVAFKFPVARLRYSGGLKFNQHEHHFIKYYVSGKGALMAFYRSHQPKNILEQHFVEGSFDNNGFGILPWVESAEASDSLGECGLDRSHGCQQYGPASDAKIDLEAKRLDLVLESISAQGYQPSHGYPRGYLLQNCENQFVCHIVGGKHRVACMAHLGYEKIPVQFQPNWPRVIRRTDFQLWPQVRSGAMTAEQALTIFDSYF